MAVLKVAEIILVSTTKMMLVALIEKFTNVIPNLSLHSEVVNVRFFNGGRCGREVSAWLPACHLPSISY